MELKRLKYINNTGSDLPKFTDGTPGINYMNRDSSGNITGFNWGAGLNIPDWTDWNYIGHLADNIATRGYVPKLSSLIDPESVILHPQPATKSPVGGVIDYKKPESETKLTRGSGVDPITPTIGFLANQYDAWTYNNTAENKRREAAAGTTNVMGRLTVHYDSVDPDKVSVAGTALTGAGSGAAAGAALGSVIAPGIGTVIGGVGGAVVGGISGLFGGLHKKKKAQDAADEANRYIDRVNQFYVDKAKTDALIEKEKKDAFLGFKEGKGLVDTVDGLKRGKQNAWVDKGEVIIDGDMFPHYREGGIHVVLRGPNDTAPAHLKDSDIVIRKELALYVPQAIATGRLGDLLNVQEQMKMSDLFTKHGLLKAKTGKLPKFKFGFGGWTVPAVFGGLSSAYQYIDAARQSIKSPNTYIANPYSSEALRTLAGIRMDGRPVIQGIRDAGARAMSAINMSGLSAAQKYLGRIANASNIQTNIGNAMQLVQAQNNQYKANYASNLLNAGQTDRQARMQANQWDLDYYSKAHAARQSGMQTGIYNFLNNMNQAYANQFKKYTYDKMLPIYWEQAKNKA